MEVKNMKVEDIKVVEEKEKNKIIKDMKKNGWVNEAGEIDIYGDDAETREEKARRWRNFINRYDLKLCDITIEEIEKSLNP